MPTTGRFVDETEHYLLVIAPPVSDAWAGWPEVFQIVSKEFGVIVDEGTNELQARYFMKHYNEVKDLYLKEGLEGLLGLPGGPGEIG